MHEAEVRDLTTEAQIDAALEHASSLPPRPLATKAVYDAAFDIVILSLDTGRRLAIPREELQGLEDATESQLAEIEIFAGVDIAWPKLDVNHYLPYLIESRYSSENWRQARKRQAVAA